MDSLDQQLTSLSPEQRRLVELWLRQAPADVEAAPSAHVIPRRPASDTAPLSFAQQRLWFLHQLDPASAAYNMRTVVQLAGPLDVAALECSLNTIVRRHEALRTTFI